MFILMFDFVERIYHLYPGFQIPFLTKRDEGSLEKQLNLTTRIQHTFRASCARKSKVPKKT